MNLSTPPTDRSLPEGHHEARRAHLLQTTSASPETPHRTRRRLLAAGLVTAGLAGTLATALIIAPTARVGRDQPVALASAAEILNRASRTAALQPDLAPRPGQFVYVESRSNQSGQPTERKIWLPADGRHAGLLTTRTGSGSWMSFWLCDKSSPGSATPKEGSAESAKVDLAHPPTGCDPQPAAFRSDLPTEPGSMLKWLYRNSHGGNPRDVQAFITVGDTVREAYIAPKALSAMFAAAARIPGVSVTRKVVDSAGRPGIAVGRTWRGLRQELIFDPHNYQLLGERTVRTGSGTDHGQIDYTSATLRIAVVDRAGQPPTN